MNRCSPEEAGFSAERWQRINRVMQGYVDQKKLAGVVSLIARQGQILYFEKIGYQDLASASRMVDDTIFRIYSMTKPITSVALMMLYEQGLLRLSDPITRFLPEFEQVKVWNEPDSLIPRQAPITIHDLLL